MYIRMIIVNLLTYGEVRKHRYLLHFFDSVENI